MKNENQEKVELRGHSFDGIQEYDNDLPRWWVRLFYATIIFSIPYMIWYHTPLFQSKSLVDEYLAETTSPEVLAAKQKTSSIDYSSPQLIAKGKEVFDANCVACHGNQGQGVIGPNLVDDHWIHGSKLADVANLIDVGVPAKGMPAWGNLLGAEKVSQLVAFIKSIQGTAVSNPKAPQGDVGKLE